MMTNRVGTLIIVAASLALSGCQSLFNGCDVPLAVDGKTEYVIVKPDEPTGVDDYAVEKLSGYLRQMTGAEFKVIKPDELGDKLAAVFVGVSAPMTERLGESDPLADLSEQEYVVKSDGPDVFLYGEGVHGNLHAALDFLEGLGWRWYSVFENPVVPSRPTLVLKPFDRKEGFSFRCRLFSKRYGEDFYLENFVNQGFESKYRRKGQTPPPHLVSFIPNECFVHSSFRYIPPNPECKYAKTFDWLKKRDYFKTNPEFFTMDESGKRVPNKQLCFGNRELRDELTKNILKHLEVSGDDQYVTVDAADCPGKFCHCPECLKLEEKYQSPGGPLYDYLIELCGVLKDKHPNTLVKTLAYRRNQTQKPPKLPDGERLPDNLIVDFAPIEDCYLADWSHPDPKIQETLQDLKDWGKITNHLWAWIYPNPWGTGHFMPVGNVERVVTNFREMRDAGVSGVFADHNGFLCRSGFSELQAYLMYQLARDVDQDADALIKEFTDHQYGAAAPLVRGYLRQLEAGRKAMTDLPPNTTYKSHLYNDNVFPYLTVENIHRWQTLFDDMENQVADDPERLANVKLLRRELDMATLWKWFDLKKAHPDYYTDPKILEERIKAIEKEPSPAGMKIGDHWKIGGPQLDNFMTVLKGGGKEKPLPPEFNGVDKSKIRTFPISRGKKVDDPDAAFGYATVIDKPDYPFVYGFFQWRSRTPRVVIPGPKVKLEKKDVKPDQYALYKLGTIKIEVADSLVHMGRSWHTHLKVGSLLYEPGERNEWDVYLSLKFEGPAYGGRGKDNRVLCDRIIMVRKED